jgi:GntR family transcriptional regulator, transcriptional repressor for pyruvate dehydrogenase complex
MSRASLRAGLGYLAAMGVLRVRHGVGAFVAEAPTAFGAASLPFLSAMPGFEDWQLFEARRVMECELAGLAAERGTEHHHTMLAECVAEMYATVDTWQEYLIHDLRFHRTIAEAAGNPILAGMMGSIASALYESRRDRVALNDDLRISSDQHRELYRAIRDHNAKVAREVMGRHLRQAESMQRLPRRGAQVPPAPSVGAARKSTAS